MSSGWTVVKDKEAWEAYCRDYEREQRWVGRNVLWGNGPQYYPALVTTYSPSLFKVVSAYLYVDEALALVKAAGYQLVAYGAPEPPRPAAEPGVITEDEFELGPQARSTVLDGVTPSADVQACQHEQRRATSGVVTRTRLILAQTGYPLTPAEVAAVGKMLLPEAQKALYVLAESQQAHETPKGWLPGPGPVAGTLGVSGPTGTPGPAGKPDPVKPKGPTQDDYNRHVNAHLVTLLNLLINRNLVTAQQYERSLSANLALVDRYGADDKARIARAVPGADSILDNLGGTIHEEG